MNPAPAATPAPRWTTRPSRPQSEGHQQQPSVTVLGLRIELLAVLVVLWCWARLAGPLGVGAALVVVAAVLGGLLPPAGTIRVADWQYAGRGYSTPADAWLSWSMATDHHQARQLVREELSSVA
jgi:hypothetical protein